MLASVQGTNRDGTVTRTVTYGYDDTDDRIRNAVADGSGAVTLDERYVSDNNGKLLPVLDGPTGSVKERYFNGNSENQVLASETGIVRRQPDRGELYLRCQR